MGGPSRDGPDERSILPVRREILLGVLQCDLIGMIVGGLMAYAVLKRRRVAVQVAA